MGEITGLLQEVSDGLPGALDLLYGRLYDDIHRLAHVRLRRNETITLLDTTGLVHDAYLRLVQAGQLKFSDRGRFFAFASSIMRSIVVDAIRKRRAERHGGSAIHVELDDQVADSLVSEDEEALRVHEALADLSVIDLRLVQVVEMRYFSGLTESEIATVLGVTQRTVRRDWEKARTLLYSALR